VRPSFVPPPPIRRLRDLTRLRTSLTREQTRHTQRIHDVLEDAMIKLAIVATDIMGVSGRAMLTALINGERDPERLAELARGRMRTKNAALIEALTGGFSDHHGLQIRLLLRHFDDLQASIDTLDTSIETELGHLCEVRERLDTIPGIGRRAAEVIIAETGADMTRFATPAHLSSWAGMCPGNNESAGKHRSTHTRKGNPWLRGCLGEAATAARRTKNTHIAHRHHQLAGRRGTKRATVATGRHILESAWLIMNQTNTTYQELGPQHRAQHTPNPHRRATHLLKQLHDLGYTTTATLTPT
jgi:transposase